MRNKIFVTAFLTLLIIGLMVGLKWKASMDEMTEVSNMKIAHVNLNAVKDGFHSGTFEYSDFTYEVKVLVKNHKIVGIKVIKNRDTSYSKKAENVIPRVIKAQSPKVDVITGATTTSKALLKAIETALKN